ncbi:MAG TPA: YtxH domain-containing protein [Clostridiaceae bacterium]|jgi:gas vesicle protein|nr:YtxH domain-containing protein [Clostridiaceae bacterium]
MRNNFTRGLILGGIIGATVSMAVGPEMNARTRKRWIKNGRYLLRRSGTIVNDIVDMFR